MPLPRFNEMRHAALVPESSHYGITVRRVTTAVGAVVSGVDLRDDPSAADVDAIGQALFDHGVILFRDQALSS